MYYQQAKTELEKAVSQLRKTKQPIKIVPRLVFNALGFSRRTNKAYNILERYLEKEELDLVSHPSTVWIDHPVEMSIRKVRVQRKKTEDPIRKIGSMMASQNEPLCVSPTMTISQAITIMMDREYSQLPVTNNGLKNLQGCLSWQSIVEAMAKGVKSNLVADYMDKQVKIVYPSEPYLSVLDIIKDYGFVLVEDKSHTLRGIITYSDLIEQSREWTEPYLLVEEIEEHIRILLDDKFTSAELQSVCQNANRTVENIDDLTIGEYEHIIENPEYWNRLNLPHIDRALFKNNLTEVRDIRNDVMHFSPDKIDSEQTEKLKRMVTFLRKLTR